jgi:hypothetical protein
MDSIVKEKDNIVLYYTTEKEKREIKKINIKSIL